MCEKILDSTDFSDLADKALKYIKNPRDNGAKEIIVLHVVDNRGHDSVPRFLGKVNSNL